jgi:hypothetical protein
MIRRRMRPDTASSRNTMSRISRIVVGHVLPVLPRLHRLGEEEADAAPRDRPDDGGGATFDSNM